jgi:Rrf2 family protein
MLSKKTKYGLKALSYLARHSKDNIPVQLSEIAEKENISRKFLENIMLSLKRNGFLRSRKGKFGGYLLAKAPEEIKLAGIIRILEGPIAMVPCVSLNYYEPCDDCQDEQACSIRKIMLEVRDASLRVYEQKTLADIA